MAPKILNTVWFFFKSCLVYMMTMSPLVTSHNNLVYRITSGYQTLGGGSWRQQTARQIARLAGCCCWRGPVGRGPGPLFDVFFFSFFFQVDWIGPNPLSASSSDDDPRHLYKGACCHHVVSPRKHNSAAHAPPKRGRRVFASRRDVLPSIIYSHEIECWV